VSVRLYFDVHVPIAIADALRLRDVDVLRAQEDGAAEFEDPRLLDRATKLERLLFTQDKGFLREATRRQKTGEAFSGIVYGHQFNVTISQSVADLEVIAKSSEPHEWIGRVEYLPF
jgi:uncharacterized protein DUF5615